MYFVILTIDNSDNICVVIWEWFLVTCIDPNLSTVLFINESQFTMTATGNVHNQHVWADKNLHVIRQNCPQH